MKSPPEDQGSLSSGTMKVKDGEVCLDIKSHVINPTPKSIIPRCAVTGTKCVSYKDYFKWLDEQAGFTILDFGFGAGVFVRRYMGRHTVLGFDIEWSTQAEDCRSNLILCDGNQPLPFPSDVFDLVNCHHVLEHLYNKDCAVEQIYRVLKPGGTFLASVPNENSLQTLPFHFLRKLNPLQGVRAIGVKPAHREFKWRSLLLYLNYFCWNDPYHIGEFNKQSIQTLLARHGFSIEFIDMEEAAFLPSCLLSNHLQHIVGAEMLDRIGRSIPARYRRRIDLVARKPLGG